MCSSWSRPTRRGSPSPARASAAGRDLGSERHARIADVVVAQGPAAQAREHSDANEECNDDESQRLRVDRRFRHDATLGVATRAVHGDVPPQLPEPDEPRRQDHDRGADPLPGLETFADQVARGDAEDGDERQERTGVGLSLIHI